MIKWQSSAGYLISWTFRRFRFSFRKYPIRTPSSAITPSIIGTYLTKRRNMIFINWNFNTIIKLMKLYLLYYLDLYINLPFWNRLASKQLEGLFRWSAEINSNIIIQSEKFFRAKEKFSICIQCSIVKTNLIWGHPVIFIDRRK